MARTIVSTAGGERPDGSCRESCAPCCMVYVARRLCASAHLRPQVVKTRLQLQGELLAAGRAPAILYRGARTTCHARTPRATCATLSPFTAARHSAAVHSSAFWPPRLAGARVDSHAGSARRPQASWRVWRSRSGKPWGTATESCDTEGSGGPQSNDGHLPPRVLWALRGCKK
jgi:hypothetical protein